jgi:hypothetical protein
LGFAREEAVEADDPSRSPATSHDKEQEALIGILIKTVEHFFGSFQKMFRGIEDPRDQEKITYSLPSLCAAGVLMFLLRLGARRQVTHQLRNNTPSCEKFGTLFGVGSVPHGDTLNDLYVQLSTDQAQESVTAMTEELIRKKVLQSERLLGRYYVVGVDGTGVLVFSERHCPHCLTQTHGNTTLYYHKVLEAKLLTPSGFTFSLMTEFVENPEESPTKQDCELKAFYRLAQRLKDRFPRLPICLSLDSLFGRGPVFDLSTRYGWKYLIVHKDNLSSVERQFQALLRLSPQNHLEWQTGTAARIHQHYDWVNDISYIDSDGREHSLSVVRCLEDKPAKDGQMKTTRFQWLTNIGISHANVVEIATDGGRIRWKIESAPQSHGKGGSL